MTAASASGASELGDLTHGAAFLVGLIGGVWLTFKVFRAVREELGRKGASDDRGE